MDLSLTISELCTAKLSDCSQEGVECDFITFVTQSQDGYREGAVDLPRLGFGVAVLARLPRLFRRLPTVTRFRACGNSIRDAGVSRILHILQSNPQLLYIATPLSGARSQGKPNIDGITISVWAFVRVRSY